MKMVPFPSLGILVAATLTVAGGCADQPVAPQSKASGQKSVDAKNSAIKPADAMPDSNRAPPWQRPSAA